MHVLMFACSSVGSWEPFIFSSVWVKWAQFYIWMNLQRSSSTPSYLPAFVSALHTLLKNESRHSVFITISQWPVGCVWVNQSFLAKTIYRTSMSVAVGSISLFFSFLSLSSPILFSLSFLLVFTICIPSLLSYLCFHVLSSCTGCVFVTFVLHKRLRPLQSRRLFHRLTHMFWHSYIHSVGYLRIKQICFLNSSVAKREQTKIS